MTIQYTNNCIFDTHADAIVNPVNCVGVAGAGLALEFRKRYKGQYLFYEDVCAKKMLIPGSVIVFKINPLNPLNGELGPKYIFHAATKNKWSEPSQLPWIALCMRHIIEVMLVMNIQSIAIPALGCGKGGLPWHRIRDIMEIEIAAIPYAANLHFEIYGPNAQKFHTKVS